jgi:hypothetical protein
LIRADRIKGLSGSQLREAGAKTFAGILGYGDQEQNEIVSALKSINNSDQQLWIDFSDSTPYNSFDDFVKKGQFIPYGNKDFVRYQDPNNVIQKVGILNRLVKEQNGGVADPEKVKEYWPEFSKWADGQQAAEERKQIAIATPTDEQYRQIAIQQLEAGRATPTDTDPYTGEDILKAPITEDGIQAKIADLKAREPSKEDKAFTYDQAQNADPIEGGIAKGLSLPVNIVAGVLRPVSSAASEYYAKLAKRMELHSAYRNQGRGPQGVYEHAADFLGATGPQIGTMVALPGGPVGRLRL